jgi:predicted DCC family thiol-disulfide oxidoreductase YuxK
MTIQTENWIIYDGECPFCSRYVKMIRLKRTIGEVRLINARENPPELTLLIERNLDINHGMAFFFDGQLYYGSECINRLALLSSSIGVFNNINYFIFKHARISRILYPMLRMGRNIVIYILGRGLIK